MSLKHSAEHLTVGLTAIGLAAGSLTFGIAAANAETTGSHGATVVRTDLGKLRGTAEAGVRSWLGVPYAAPPVDELRWESPQPAEPWRGIRDADQFTEPCAQIKSFMPGIPSTNEDCLHLNVYAPDTRDDDLPVMVWFHGGGNTYGAAQQYDPSRLVADGEVVVVTVDYRQGVFASLAHPALDASDGEILSGNYGLEDQQAALEWVRENAEAFGGESENVTIFGESGGGFDVCTHLTAPSSAGLFDKAIMQSSPCMKDWAVSREDGQEQSEAIAAAEGVSCDKAEDVAACLRSTDATALMDAASPNGEEFQPVAGGPVMEVLPAEALQSGQINDVEVLHGINRDEMQAAAGGSEIYAGHVMTPEEYHPELVKVFGADADLVAEQYPLSDYENPAKALGAAWTDAEWATASDATTELLADQVPTFTYELAETDTPWFNFIDAPAWPVDSHHTVDLAYLFETSYFEARDERQDRLADLMVEYWTEFARSGDPDGRGCWKASDDRVRGLSSDGPSNVDFADVHHLEFWENLNA